MATNNSHSAEDARRKILVNTWANTSQKQKGEGSKRPVKLPGEVVDITGRDAYHVLGQLSGFLNKNREKAYYLMVKSEADGQLVEEMFEIKAKPAPGEPGNGAVRMRCRGEARFTQKEKTYAEVNGELERTYGKSVSTFALHMKQLFSNNARIAALPQITGEVYIILLFEISRRLVQCDAVTDKQQELDKLPIGTAITRIVKLLEKDKTLRFNDVFLPDGKYHCFTGEPAERQAKIDTINEHYAAAELKEMLCPNLQGIHEFEELPIRKVSRPRSSLRKKSA